jgi:opacity protein-like surface antigen
MKRLLLALCLAAPFAALAQAKDDDAPIPYDDDDVQQPTAPAVKKKARRVRDRIREEDEEARAGEQTLAHLDDPSLGLSGEVLAGAMLFDSSRGALVDPRFMIGVRFTWEFGRLIPDEYLREMFFADVTWQYAQTSDGTTQVHADSSNHYFTVAPAVAWPFGKSPVAAYGQVGAGFNYVSSTLHVDVAETTVEGVKFLFQYGLGLRFRPEIVRISEHHALRLSFRIEVTRFVRGYLQDTFLGGSVGATF